MFDEICLSGGLTYNATIDQIDGFVNTGIYKNQQIADHALWYEALKKNFKQLLPTYFAKAQPNNMN